MQQEINKKALARRAFLERLNTYWNTVGFLKFNSRIGEIYEVDFGENVGSEFSGRHLAICLSNTKTSDDRMLVIPLTTKYKEYNLEHIIEVDSFVDNKKIKAGVVLNEVRYISKKRIFKTSLILGEDESDKLIPVGYVEISKSQLNKFRKIDV